MGVATSSVTPAGSTGSGQRDAHRALVADLQDKLAAARLGGSERSRTRHVERGKLLPRDRVDALVDPSSPFLELSPLAAHGHVRRRGPGRRHDHRGRPGRRAASA